ncbi:L-aminoadipate-semialdehyde dehydrogenase-phosphopantetheinyl transferase [Ceratocystis lukuohia]|uniref:holo-[acyl-carrier-protein] synthase n=3 Tax=Ceratocystis TaxID=5157 RepID=A0A0F8BTM5_CERFI|nr:L-aminoadipate-semialdehyde dehydrogenase-phosphopantetheinyl transferase [Ceratocystis platani]PHH50599.1 hypothetical protein CFIMG_006467RA [Ceratocystis fimbriata CBS 114723]
MAVAANNLSSPKATVVQWVVDTRKLWPSAVQTSDLLHAAKLPLSLLTYAERQKALGFVFAKDAKLSLVSSLLKRLLISRYANVPWSEAHAQPDSHQKPVYRCTATNSEPVAFNISHQDGLVVLAAVCGYPRATENDPLAGIVEVGVDIVSTSERRSRDLAGLAASDAWDSHVDVYAEIFAPAELRYLKSLCTPPHIAPASSQEADFRLRYFYALWCLREAYVKMDGQALTAPWITALEFRSFHPPVPGTGVVDGFNVCLHGVPVHDARIELRSLGEDYMVATAIRTPARPHAAAGFALGPYLMIDLEAELRAVVGAGL